MRRYWVVALAVLTLVGVLSPPAFAQAPAPKVTISGLIDQVGTFSRNVSVVDVNLNRNSDHQMYGRTRGRFDVIGEVGPAKGVLGLEIDSVWGQTGFTDSNAAGCAAATSGAVTCGAVLSGSESSFDLNTDTQANLQIKWLYTEFPVPLIPWATTMTLGAQPFGSAATYKLAAYANGDFPGVKLVTTVTPNLKLLFTYVAVEELLTGKKDIAAITTGGVPAAQPQSRGDDFALIFSAEYTPMKGLDVKPMYSYFYANGVTTPNARQGRGGMLVATSPATAAAGPVVSPFAPRDVAVAAPDGIAGNDGVGTGISENRHTIGVDARWRSGPWSLDPTVLYQFGSRQAVITELPTAVGGTAVGAAGGSNLLTPYGTLQTKHTADINAWLIDIRGGYVTGPWTFQGLYLWTSGNRAQDNPYSNVNYYQPLDTDTSYQGDWGTQIWSLGVDYYQILNGAAGVASTGLNPGVAIGYDKYGRHQFGLKASYAWTPALSTGLGWTSLWTDREVDTDSINIAGAGLLPSFVCRKTLNGCRPEGDHSYLGTELNAGLTWRFAPGLAFDWAFGYLVAGPALGHRTIGRTYDAGAGVPVPKDIGVDDVITTVARVRYTF